MATNSKHAEGKLYIGDQSTIRADNGQEHVWQHETLFIYTGGNKANASRIVTMWNNWDELKDMLSLIVDRVEENEFQPYFPSAYNRAKALLDKLSS